MDTIEVTVSSGLTPTISWNGDCAIGRLTVGSDLLESWGIETYGVNTYNSPIVYGVNPPGTAPEEPAMPLVEGQSYALRLYTWITYEPEVLDTLVVTEFTP